MSDESKAASSADAGVNQEWQLASYPDGDVTVDNMKLVDIEMPSEVSTDGNVLLRINYLSVDPYMRGRMSGVRSYADPFVIGEAMKGFGVATVIKSRDDSLAEGDLVHGFFPWRRVFEYPAGPCRKLDMSTTPGYEPSIHLGVLGLTGLTAYFPIERIAEVKEGDVVYVSGAAGAVGLIAGQIFKAKGCRVIGSAGTAEKVALLKEVGFDAAFNYKTDDVKAALTEFSADGYNVYWDNVGGPVLDLMLTLMAKYGRIIACGAISQYNKKPEEAYGYKNLGRIIGSEIKMQGFILTTYLPDAAEGVVALATMLMKGQLQQRETVVDGFGKVAEALVGLFSGKNIGKMVVKA